jgi:hypothetical protein
LAATRAILGDGARLSCPPIDAGGGSVGGGGGGILASTPIGGGSDLIGRVIIAPENDSENATMMNSLNRFCTDKKNSKY